MQFKHVKLKYQNSSICQLSEALSAGYFKSTSFPILVPDCIINAKFKRSGFHEDDQISIYLYVKNKFYHFELVNTSSLKWRLKIF